jgi:hypothetical protein
LEENQQRDGWDPIKLPKCYQITLLPSTPITGQDWKEQEIHTSCLRLYEEGITEEVLEFAAHSMNASYYEVKDLVDIREQSGNFDIKVCWRGFDEEDQSWEPIEMIYEDVPLLVEQFLIQRQQNRLLNSLRNCLKGFAPVKRFSPSGRFDFFPPLVVRNLSLVGNKMISGNI